MNIYTCNTFKGHWPVGTSAVVIADDEKEARQLLSDELVKDGLEPLAKLDELIKLDLTSKKAIILDNGDY